MALVGALLFGINASTTKVLVTAGIDPSVLVLYRSLATSMLAAVVLAFTHASGFRLTKREIPMLVMFGIFGVGLMQWAYSQAVFHLPVGVALLIEYTAIVWVPLTARLIYKEKLNRGIWISVGLVLAGLFVVAKPWSSDLSLIGLLFAALAAILVTVYFLIGEHTQKSRDTMSTLAYSMLVSSLLWLVLSPWQRFDWARLTDSVSLLGNLSNIHLPLSVMLIWIGVFGSFIPMALSYRALHHLSATGVGIASTSETVFAALFGFVWLGENLSGPQIAGGVLVIIGIVSAQVARLKQTKEIA